MNNIIKSTIIGACLLLATGLVAPERAKAETPSGSWKDDSYGDDFDGHVKQSFVRSSTTTRFGSRDVYLIVRKIEGETRAFVITGDSYICKDGLDWDLQVSFIIDGGDVFKQKMGVSDSNKALFFRRDRTSAWIKEFNEGKSFKMRYTDGCSERSTLEFDISGHTGFGK